MGKWTSKMILAVLFPIRGCAITEFEVPFTGKRTSISISEVLLMGKRTSISVFAVIFMGKWSAEMG
jgi:hypothetical protein